MRFENQEGSDHVDDQRGSTSRRGSSFGGMRLPIGRGRMGRGGLGIGGLLLLLAIGWAAGLDPMQLLNGNVTPLRDSGPVLSSAAEEAQKEFVRKVLATTETCWRDLFASKFNRSYEEPTLVLFRDEVRSACGVAGASVGPFYCPGDNRLYLDMSFFDEMARSLGAEGDFAQAYVIAHEVGHHVQNLLGTNRKVQALEQRGGANAGNQASIRLELQADYYAGVWAHYVQHRMRGKVTLDMGDYEEAMRAANAVGDDTLQRRATGRVVPENFTHGSAAQRTKWFKLGFESGDPTAHDPFVEER